MIILSIFFLNIDIFFICGTIKQEKKKRRTIMKSDTTAEILQSAGISLLLGKDTVRRLPATLKARGMARVFLLADKNTYRAAGERVHALLTDAEIAVSSYIFESDHLEPNESAVGLATMHFDPTVDAVVGVGSGVINDISKIVANVSGMPYIIVATAANAGTVPEPHSASTWLLCAEASPPSHGYFAQKASVSSARNAPKFSFFRYAPSSSSVRRSVIFSLSPKTSATSPVSRQ